MFSVASVRIDEDIMINHYLTFSRAKGAGANIVEEPHFNENARFDEFTFRDLNGYAFTAWKRHL